MSEHYFIDLSLEKTNTLSIFSVVNLYRVPTGLWFTFGRGNLYSVCTSRCYHRQGKVEVEPSKYTPTSNKKYYV